MLLHDEATDQGQERQGTDNYVHRQTATREQRQASSSSLLTSPPEKYNKLVDPYDPKQDLNARARSYLHANCSQCHVEAGGGNAQMDLEFLTKPEK